MPAIEAYSRYRNNSALGVDRDGTINMIALQDCNHISRYDAAGNGTDDDTAAFQDAAEEIAETGIPVICDAKTYLLDGDIGGAQKGAINYPQIGSTQPIISMDFIGTGNPRTSARDGSVKCTVFKRTNNDISDSYPDGGVEGAVEGGRHFPSVFSAKAYVPGSDETTFNKISMGFSNIMCSYPDNAKFSFFNAHNAAHANFFNVCGQPAAIYTSIVPPTRTDAAFIILPAFNNNTFSTIFNCGVLGYYTGFRYAEHAKFLGQVVAAGCKIGMVGEQGSHLAEGSVNIEQCWKDLLAVGTHSVRLILNIEYLTANVWNGKGFSGAIHIDGGANILHGHIDYNLIIGNGGGNTDDLLTRSGCADVSFKNLWKPNATA